MAEVEVRADLTVAKHQFDQPWPCRPRLSVLLFPQHQAFSRLSQTFKFIQTAFGSVKLSIASVPCSRPKPESRTPPQGNRTSV
jgi:hypothetical protein